MKRLVIHGVEMATVDEGQGRPVVLLHAFPLDHRVWEAQIAALAPRYRVVAPDLRGFGQSQVTDGPVTMEQFADDVAGLLRALGVSPPVVLAGLSMGGYVALAFWRRYAQWVNGLVLCDTRAAADSAEGAATRRALAERVLREGPDPLVEAMMPRLWALATRQCRPELIERTAQIMRAADPRGIAAAALGMAMRPDSTPLLAQMGCPVLAIVGQEDVISPVAEMEQIVRAVPQGRLITVAEAGHLAPLEQPEAVNRAILEFLSGLA